MEAPPAPPPAAPAAQSAETASAAPTTPEPPKAEPLTDEQIVKITEAVNLAEIDQAKLAQKKSKNAKVKKFAAQMIAEHNQAKNKGAAWVKKAKITPADSTVGSDLSSKSMQQLESLKGVETDFDKTYIDGQVQAHQEVLSLLDTALIPAAQAADLKKQLEDTRAMVDKHLTHAKEIQAALAAAPATPQQTGSTSAPAKAGAGSSASASAGSHGSHGSASAAPAGGGTASSAPAKSGAAAK
jgi:putative membrane protein